MGIQCNFMREQPTGRRELFSHRNLRKELEATHRQIEFCIEDLQAVTSDGPPVGTQFSTIRLRIGKAILARRRIAHDAYSRLLAEVASDDVAAVRDLQQRELAQFHFTSEIIGHWTPQLLQGNWQEYCEASRRVRDGMREIIAAEKRLLYPLLDRLL